MYKLDNLHPVNVHVFIDGCLSHTLLGTVFLTN